MPFVPPLRIDSSIDPLSITFCAYDTPDSCGGPFAWAPRFAAQLAERGANVHVLVINIGDVVESKIATTCLKQGIKVSTLDDRVATTLEDQAEWILRIWRQSPTEIFIANLVLPALFASKWIKDAGAATVGVVHSNPDFDPFYQDLIDHFVIPESEWQLTACVAVSRYLASQIRSRVTGGIRIAAIPCGAEVTNDCAVRSDDALKLLYCGRIVQDPKRIKEVVHAFLRASERYPQVSASICGVGPESTWVKDALLGQSRVAYLGGVPAEQMRSKIAEHHVIVLLSQFEGAPITMIEAMLSGVVPVCTADPSWSAEVITSGTNGLLVDDREHSVLNAIESLIDMDMWQRLSENAVEDAKQRYSYSVIMRNWWELLNGLPRSQELKPNLLPDRVSLASSRGLGKFATYHNCRSDGEAIEGTRSVQLAARAKRILKRVMMIRHLLVMGRR